MATKKSETKQIKSNPIPADEIQQGINIMDETTEDVLTQATKAVGTVMDLGRQASKLAVSLGLGATQEGTGATAELTKEMGNATNTLMTSSVDALHVGSDAVKTTAKIGVTALNTTINLGKDLAKVAQGLILLTGEVVEASGEIIEVSGKMIKTLGRIVESLGKVLD